MNSTADAFVQLAGELTQFVYLHRFPHPYLPEGEGYYFLRPLRLPGRRIGKRPSTLEIDCSYVTESKGVVTVFPKVWAIRFQIMTSAPEQIKVIAECNHYSVVDYFDYLLGEIARRCPESREAIEAEIDEKRAAEMRVIIEESPQRMENLQCTKGASDGMMKPPMPAVDMLDPLDHKIIEVVCRLEDGGRKATDELVARRLPLNPKTDEPYHRVTINKRRCALRDKGYKV